MAIEYDFDKMWDYSNPAATEKKFRELLPEAEKKKDKSYLIELWTQIARTQSLQLKFDKAHEILDKVMKMLKPEHIRPRIRFMLERGRTYNSSKVPDKARELFEAAYQQAKKYNEDFYAIDAAHMLGIAYMMGVDDKPAEALNWSNIAIDLIENTGDQRAKKWLGPLYNNTAWTYHDVGDYGKALDLFEKNVEWHMERNSKKELGIAKWSVARAKRSLGRFEDALKEQEELEKWYKEAGIAEDGYVFEEIGENLLLLNRAEESKPAFAKAYELLKEDKWLVEYEKDRLDRLKTLGGVV
jgi:tetratricopeptide (TPR) repeat protein